MLLYEIQREMTENKLLKWMFSDAYKDGMIPKGPKKLAKKARLKRRMGANVQRESRGRETSS